MDKSKEREYTMNCCGKQYKDTDLEKTSAYTRYGERSFSVRYVP
jgi:hypothetical protein